MGQTIEQSKTAAYCHTVLLVSLAIVLNSDSSIGIQNNRGVWSVKGYLYDVHLPRPCIQFAYIHKLYMLANEDGLYIVSR